MELITATIHCSDRRGQGVCSVGSGVVAAVSTVDSDYELTSTNVSAASRTVRRRKYVADDGAGGGSGNTGVRWGSSPFGGDWTVAPPTDPGSRVEPKARQPAK